MDEYRAKRDCYYEGHFLKKGDIYKVKKGTEVKFKLLEKVGTVTPAPAK